MPHMCAFTGARAHRRIQASFYRRLCVAAGADPRRDAGTRGVHRDGRRNRALLIATNVRDLFGKTRLTLEAVLFDFTAKYDKHSVLSRTL